MTASTPEQQARRRAELAAELRRPQPRRSRWTRDDQQRHRTQLQDVLDGTAWDQPIPNPLRRPTRKVVR